MTRSARPQPVTPQRLPRQHQQHRYSQSLYKSPTTPTTPYSPLSFRSATSAGSSTLTTPDNSGTYSKRLILNSCSPLVSKTSRSGSGRDRSLADIAENWRSRANENGIKVTSENSYTEGSQFGDDEASERTLSDSANDLNVISSGEALLPPPFLSNHRRNPIRPRAQTQASIFQSRPPSSPTITRSNRAAPTSPLNSRRSLNMNQSENLMATPPPNRILSSQLKLKGSFTDPAHTRRREAFGVVHTPSQNTNAHVRNTSFTYGLNPDTSLDLFDIDEGDFEDYDTSDYPSQINQEESFSLDVESSFNDYGYPSYPLKFSQSQFADPFQGGNGTYGTTSGLTTYNTGQNQPLGTISENAEYSFQPTRSDGFRTENGDEMFLPGLEPNFYPFASHISQNTYYNPPFVPFPAVPMSVTQMQPPQLPSQPIADTFVPPTNVSTQQVTSLTPPPTKSDPQAVVPSECSVCLVKRPRTLAILMPCRHPLCSACLTSALNIVGEKDMECAVCKLGVDDFCLITVEKDGINLDDVATNSDSRRFSKISSSSSMGHDTHVPDTKEFATVPVNGHLQDDFAFGIDCDGRGQQGDPFIRASTPKEEQSKCMRPGDARISLQSQTRTSVRNDSEQKENDNVVLRIDNVPWDITPPLIKNWLQQPVERVHVLLDAKGKTLSHAYVEVRNADIAGAILRGEAQGSAHQSRSGKKERSSVLGRGRRARGVTVTRSGQEELMADLFPKWRGTFDGSRPSLAGLAGDHIIDALEGGLMTESELRGLLYLIREPDSHFLKVPSLPFHLLISILSKFPSDVDSRVFWSAAIRDLLYDVTYAAGQILLSRAKEQISRTSIEDSHAYPMDLVAELIQTAVECRALTSQQTANIRVYAKQEAIPILDSDEAVETSLEQDNSAATTVDSEHLSQCEPLTPGGLEIESSDTSKAAKNVPFGELAREFGVDAQLVQALAQRLAGLGA
ncbi:hypothetical protein AMATHDRAFT_7452 [Amanita thiersii Skay4041]|uniref:RING-type domain-containing protein n=1 Tax=Amanita thiersii Skay4041 TaxID=703135 RepID=A0A2A9NG41_9AGAR|nr:hypothetical protein AMATHDRAFT_7452 [Amanita thiersii Skay4041]